MTAGTLFSDRINCDNGSRHVGRVGALAVALGIGAAVVALPGLAVADTQGSGGAAGSVAASDSTAGGTRGSAHDGSRSARSARSGSAGVSAAGSVAGRAAGPVAGRASAVRPVRTAVVGAGSSSAGGSEVPPAAAAVRVAGPAVRGSAVRGSAVRGPAVPGVPGGGGQSAALVAGSAETAPAVDAAGNGRAEVRSAAVRALPSPAGLYAGRPSPGELQARIDVAVRSGFNAAENWLLNHSGSPLAGFLEGALLMVRRHAFNQAPVVIPSEQSTSSDGLLTGRIGAIDYEGDVLSYEVLDAPATGTVELDQDGVYTFTPGESFTGLDTFTVKIAPQTRSVNLTNLPSDGSRTVAINIGSRTLIDAPDVGVYLPKAQGSLTVTKNQFGQTTGTVTLRDVTPNTVLKWIDTTGQVGVVSIESLATQHWPQFQATAQANGATVNLTLGYTGADGAPTAVLLDGVQVGKDDAGQYVFTGRLAANPELNPRGLDRWDVVGADLKPQYDKFLADNIGVGGGGRKFTPVNIDFTNASLFVDTLTPRAYGRTGMYEQDSENNPQSAGTGNVPVAAPTETTADATADATATANAGSVTSSVSQGRTVYIGRDDGAVEAWVQGQRTFLNNPSLVTPVSTSTVNVSLLRGDTLIVGRGVKQVGGGLLPVLSPEDGGVEAWKGNELTLLSPKPGPTIPAVWKSSVNTLLEYDHLVTDSDGTTVYDTGFIVGLGNGAVQLWSDNTNDWIELRSSTEFAVTAMISYGTGVVTGGSNGSVQQWNGPGANSDTATWKDNWTELKNAGWASAVTAMLPYNARNAGPYVCYGGCPGFLVGLANGSVQQYNDDTNGPGKPGWKELHDSGWKSPVVGFVLSKDAPGQRDNYPPVPTFAVGLKNGAIEQYQWNNDKKLLEWKEIRTPNRTELTSMSQFGQNFLIGIKNSDGGSVSIRVNPGPGNPYGSSGESTWFDLNSFKSAPHVIVPQSATAGTGVYVGLDDGTVKLWNGQQPSVYVWKNPEQWTQLHDGGWASGVRTLTQTGINGGIAVGLKNGTLQQWTPTGSSPQNEWTELVYDDPYFDTPVSQLLPYNRPLKDSEGNQVYSSFTGYISGTTLTVTSLEVGSTVAVGSEITGVGVEPGTRITKFIEQSAQCVDSNCAESAGTTGSGAGGSSGYPGAYEVSKGQTVGSSVPAPSPEDPSLLAPAGIRLTQPGNPAVTASVIAALNDGTILLRSSDSNEWIQLLSGTGATVTSMINYGEGVVTAQSNGSVFQWTGPGKDPDTATWKNNWTELRSGLASWSAATVLEPYKGYPSSCPGGCPGFLLGSADSSVWQYNEATNGPGKPGWTELHDSGWKSPVVGIVLSKYDGAGLPTFAVGLKNGAIEQRQWNNDKKLFEWKEIRTPNGTELTSMSQFGQNFLIGVKNSDGGSVSIRVNPGPGNPYGSSGESTWVGLNSFKSAPTQMVPFQSATLGTGVVVGLANGAVKLWNGQQPSVYVWENAKQWTELHDGGWKSTVKTLALAPAQATDANGDAGWQDGVLVGLANGATEQWSGLITGKTGQNDWTELVGYRNFASDALAYKENLSCEQLACSNKGSLQSAVGFATSLSGQKWGSVGGVGGPTDPIFSQPMLQSGSKVNGTYHAIAFTKPDSQVLGYQYPLPLGISGEVLPATLALAQGWVTNKVDPCGDGRGTGCSILRVRSVIKTNELGKLPVPVTPVDAQNDPKFGKYFPPSSVGGGLFGGTVLQEYLGPSVDARPGQCLGGTCTVYRVSGPADQYVQPAPLSTTQNMTIEAAPGVRVGVDVIPLIYGYTYIPDGFLPKFKAANWSVGALAAAKIGPSITVNVGSGGTIYGPEKDVPLFNYFTPGPLGIDSLAINTGFKVSAGITLNGAEKPTLKFYAYEVPGALFTFNSAGAPGQMQAGINDYLDFSARDLYSISGVSITATVTPYANLAYGVMVPKTFKVIGGWSLFELSAGYENPIYATACGDFKGFCAAGGTNKVANFYGAINDGSSGLAGDVLTVTRAAVLGSKPQLGQVLTGPGVLPGTTITRYIGPNDKDADQYRVAICESDGMTCSPTEQSSGGYLSAVSPGSYNSVTIGAQGNLTFHAGVIEAITPKLSYNAKTPLYDINQTFSAEQLWSSVL